MTAFISLALIVFFLFFSFTVGYLIGYRDGSKGGAR